MSDHFKAIYRGQADDYDLLVSREDFQGNLLPALEAITPLAGVDVVEFGAGTGRLTRLIVPLARMVYAFDMAEAMLAKARLRFDSLPYPNWRLQVGDNGNMPMGDGVVDVALAGWTFGHTVDWYPQTWRAMIDGYIAEMQRVLKPGGMAIIIETMGTGSDKPQPPTPGLAAYYGHLEQQHGFHYRWIRTDYRFESVAEAERLLRFFFGDDLAVRRENSVTVPECTGIWSVTV